jgi:hypothetical protein
MVQQFREIRDDKGGAMNNKERATHTSDANQVAAHTHSHSAAQRYTPS